MTKDRKVKKKDSIKGFFARFIEKVDKKMEEKARKSPCGCDNKIGGDNSCCS